MSTKLGWCAEHMLVEASPAAVVPSHSAPPSPQASNPKAEPSELGMPEKPNFLGDSHEMGKKLVEGLLQDDTTTIMLRNIPNRYTYEALLAEILAAGFEHMPFDFFYLPRDFNTRMNRGYAFINFHSPEAAKEFALAFHDRQLSRYPTKKVLEVAPAATQGYEANMSKYFKKGSKHVRNDWFKPMLFPKPGD
ncbi:TE1 [Symbiodinium natans]|uniref:TE1 protein n=1 Tax=Symbiodinium natans TaxID=878477 RepID=A0A812TPK7_9DINO|nr:TE1 [Symbiodinium natans]